MSKKNNNFNKKILFILLSINTFNNFAADILKGNSDNETKSFSFNVNNIIQNNVGGRLYASAAPGQGGGDMTTNFAVSFLNNSSNEFMPLTPETITLNSQAKQTNPLFDQSILSIALLESNDNFSGSKEHLVVVSENTPSIIYLFDQINSADNISVLSAANIPDTAGNITEKIVQLAASNKHHIFAAVAPNGGVFGNEKTKQS